MPDALLTAVRSRLGVERLSHIESLPGKTIEDTIGPSYRNWSKQFVLSPKPGATIRPVITPTSLSSLDVPKVSLRTLLLCQQIAIGLPDSIGWVRPMFHLLVQLEDFIDEDLVLLVPDFAHLIDDTEKIFDFRAFFGTWLNSREEGSLSNGTPEEMARAEEDFIAGGEISMALDYCRRYPDSLDLACRNPVQHRQFQSLLDKSLNYVSSSTLETHDRLTYLPDLLSLELPDTRNLSIADLVAVHKHGLFDDWKSALTEGLALARQIDDVEYLQPGSARIREVRSALEAAARRTRETVGRSRSLEIAKRTSSFGIAVAAGALGALGGPMSAGAAAGGAFAVTTLINWLGGRPTSGTRAFRKMVTQFFVT
jgi:hypothetical protein